MTKKRFIKLVLSYRIQRNEAYALTLEVSKAGSYKRLYLWFLIRRFPIMLHNPSDLNGSQAQCAMWAIRSEVIAHRRNPDFDLFAEELFTHYLLQNAQRNALNNKLTHGLECIVEIIRRAVLVIQAVLEGITAYITQAFERTHAVQTATNALHGIDPASSPCKTAITITPPTFRAAAITRNLSDQTPRPTHHRRETMQYGS